MDLNQNPIAPLVKNVSVSCLRSHRGPVPQPTRWSAWNPSHSWHKDLGKRGQDSQRTASKTALKADFALERPQNYQKKSTNDAESKARELPSEVNCFAKAQHFWQQLFGRRPSSKISNSSSEQNISVESSVESSHSTRQRPK